LKYLVMETHDAYCIVLDQAGRFIKADNEGYLVGQRLDQISEYRSPRSRLAWRRTIMLAASMAAAVLIIFALQIYQEYFKPFASVYFKINPEIRIDVNRHDRVIELEALNDEAETLLQGYDARRQDLEIVTDELIERAIKVGFLVDGGTVTLALTGPEDWFRDKGVDLRKTLSQKLETKASVSIQIVRFMPDHSFRSPGLSKQTASPPDITGPDPTAIASPEVTADHTRRNDVSKSKDNTRTEQQMVPVDNDDSDYTVKPTAAPTAKPTAEPTATQRDDSGYDDSEYDDNEYDDSDYDYVEDSDDSRYDDSEYDD
jgi:nucleotide-binding universal stress UspA family protein